MLSYLAFAKYYKKLIIKDEFNTHLYIRFSDPSLDENKCASCCIPQKSLTRGIKISYENIKTYRIIKWNSCDSTTDGYNCCNKKIIYNADAFECAKKGLFELQLKQPITLNQCESLVNNIYDIFVFLFFSFF